MTYFLPGAYAPASLGRTQKKRYGVLVFTPMEWVVLNDTMQPVKFTVVHRGSKLSDKDKKDILHWVKTTRAAYYATGTASAETANEPLQPLLSHIAVDVKKATLGKKLFNGRSLSADSTLVCSGCHAYEKA